MPTIKIDIVDHHTNQLSDEAKAQLISLQSC
jgi:phenylpyruvate tautomerase PptA (4-oxalocrotonate tautomerase family)